MKVILHIGAAKTGSTALQASLDKARDDLEKEGVWYPLVEKRVTRRQNILATPFQRKLQRVYVGKTFGGKPAPEFAKRAWNRIAKRAHEYNTVIISSEHLGGISDLGAFAKFFKAKFPDADARAVYYLRRPSQHTASRMQQRIGANHVLTDFRPINFLRIIEAWKEILPVELREFSSSTLVGGSIAKDFASTIGLKMELPEIRKNESLSAEAMQILQDYRLRYYEDTPNRFFPDSDDLKSLLKSLPSEKDRKAVFRPDVSDILDRSKFVFSLKERHGFEFQGLDYAQDPADKEAMAKIASGTEVRDFMIFDEARFSELLEEVRREASEKNIKEI